MTVVVDASVALKWVLEEEDADRATDLAVAELMIAPDLLFIECANVLAMNERRGIRPAGSAVRAFDGIKTSGVRLIPSVPHLDAALDIAGRLRRTVYDCLYLAVALEERAVLVTADRRFYAAAAADTICSDSIRLL